MLVLAGSQWISSCKSLVTVIPAPNRHAGMHYAGASHWKDALYIMNPVFQAKADRKVFIIQKKTCFSDMLTLLTVLCKKGREVLNSMLDRISLLKFSSSLRKLFLVFSE